MNFSLENYIIVGLVVVKFGKVTMMKKKLSSDLQLLLWNHVHLQF